MPTYTNVTIAQCDSTDTVTFLNGVSALWGAARVLIRVDDLPREGSFLNDLELDIEVGSALQPCNFAVDVAMNGSAPLALGLLRYRFQFVRNYTVSSNFSATMTNFPGWISEVVSQRWRYHPKQTEQAMIFRLRVTSGSGILVFSPNTGTFTSTETAEPRFTPSGMEYVDDYTRGVGKQLGVCARSGNAYPLAELVTDPVTNSKVHWRYVDPPAHRSGRPTRGAP